MTARPRRVPPPPPPGFGDEEYYKLYGEPEEYQKYRRDLETKLQRKDGSSPPQHEEYYVYRRFKSHEESYDYYYGPRQREGSPSSKGREGRKRRIAPPPPPGFEDEPPSPPPSKKRIAPPPPTDFSSEGDSGDTEGPQVFKNFRVTIKNETDGTPSLSESDGERRGRGKGKKKRKRKKEREREKRRRLEKKLAKREQELKLLSKRRNLSGGAKEEEDPKQAEAAGVTEKPRKSVKDRLGDKKVVVKKEKLSPVRLSSAEKGRREELLRRAEVRRQNQEKSPIPYQGKRRSRSRGRRKRSDSSQSKSRNRGKKSRSRSNKRGGRSRSRSRKRNISGRSRRSSSRRRNTGRRSRSPLRRGPVKLNKKKRKRRRRDRERDRARRRGGMGIRDLENMKEENEEMRAKLADRLKRKGQKPVGGSLEDRLAEMAGIGGMKAGPGDRERRSGSSSSESDGYDSESGSDSEAGKGRKGNKKEQTSEKKVGGKMRSDKVMVDLKDSVVKTPDKWQHDKFEGDEERDTPEKETDAASFGKHWSKIRSERSKERERKKSRSRSRSRRSRSGTGSRSRTRSRTRRKKRRGKFSRSRSGSSSESSRSRSKSYSSRSRSSTRSPLHKKAKAPIPPATGNNPTAKPDGEDKEGVNLELSGALTTDANSFNGAVIKYAEPAEARKPKKKWRLYVFKGNEELPILYIHRQSAYLLGRDRKIADIALDHPSCSKQHSALQYRLVPYTRPDSTQGRRVQLYIMDLASANGTFVNNNKIEPQKYVQLMEKDVLKFGFSSREYVLLHDQSKEEEEDMGVD